MRNHRRVTLLLVYLMIIVVESLTCHRAEYLTGTECCPMCPIGTRVNRHCTEFRSTSCLPCDSGTYMDEPTGKEECLRCRSCDSGSGLRVKAPCSYVSNTVCEPEGGHFCVGPLEEGSCGASQRHRSCQPGQYVSQPGSASADTQCSTCAQGTFSNGSVFHCQPHTQCEQMDKVTVKQGTSESDAQCGERPSNVLVIVIGVVVGVVIISIVLVLTVYFLKNKKVKNRVPSSRAGPTEEENTLQNFGPDRKERN